MSACFRNALLGVHFGKPRAILKALVSSMSILWKYEGQTELRIAAPYSITLRIKVENRVRRWYDLAPYFFETKILKVESRENIFPDIFSMLLEANPSSNVKA